MRSLPRRTRRLTPFAVAVAAVAVVTLGHYAKAGLPVNDPRGAKATSLYLRGRDLLDRGSPDKALPLFDQAIQLAPTAAEFYSARAQAHEKLKKPQLAKQDRDVARTLYESAPPGTAKKANSNIILVQNGNQPTPQAPSPLDSPQAPSPLESPQAPSPLDSPASPNASAPAPANIGSDIASLFTNKSTASAEQAQGAPTSVVNTNRADAPADSGSTGALLEQTPTVSVRRTSSLNLDPRVRGYHSNQMNATANGVNLYKARVDIDPLFSAIDSGIVDDITVIDGPYSSMYGPGFAFLNARLKMPERYNCSEFHFESALSYVSNGRQIYNRETSYGGGKNWGFISSFGIRTGNDYSPGQNSTDFHVPSSYQQWDSYFATRLDLTSDWHTEISYVRVEKNNVKLPGVIYDIRYSQDEILNIRLVNQENLDDIEHAVVQYWYSRNSYDGNSRDQDKNVTFYNRFLTQSFRGFPGNVNNPGDPASTNLAATFGRGSLQTNGFRSFLAWGDKDSTIFTVGADWRRYDQFYQETHLDFAGRPKTIIFGDNSFGVPGSSMDDYGLFSNLVVPVNDRLTSTFGGRIDFTHAFASLDQVNAGLGNPNAFGISNRFSGQSDTLGMLYNSNKLKITDETSIDAGMAFAMRQPSLTELYSDGPFVPLVRQGNSVVSGNSDLQPEKNLQFDLGMTRQNELFIVGAKGYYSSISDYILYVLDNPGTGQIGNVNNGAFSSRAYTYRNIDRATLYGGSLFGELKVYEGIALNGTMNYVYGTNEDPRQGNGAGGLVAVGNNEGLPNILPLTSTIGLRFYEPENNKYGVEFLTHMTQGQYHIATSLGDDTTPGYTTFDIRSHYQVNKNFRLTSSIENLFDRTYTQHGSLVVVDGLGNRSFVREPGFSWRLGGEFKF